MAGHADPRLVPGVVPRAAWQRDRPRASGGLRLVALSYLRHGAGDDDLPAPAPLPAMNHEARWLCCEGACSPNLHLFRKDLPRLAAVGYTESSTRGQQSAACTHTLHYFVRTSTRTDTVFQTWACTKCGHERTYGAEEP